MCRLVITEYGLRLQKMRNGYVKKNQEVNRFSEIEYYYYYYYYFIFCISMSHFLSELSQCSNINNLTLLFHCHDV